MRTCDRTYEYLLQNLRFLRRRYTTCLSYRTREVCLALR